MSEVKRRLVIEWRRLEVGGATCDRCERTGRAVREAMDRLRQDVNTCDVAVSLVETGLDEGSIAQSNLILVNGVALETLLKEAASVMTDCASCGCLTGRDTRCRAIVENGFVHEAIPADLIHSAALAALERQLDRKGEPT